MYRSGMIKILIAGLLIGLLCAPLLWFGSARLTTAQSLPFTPTPEPTATLEPSAIPSTATPTIVPATAQPIIIIATPTTLPPTATPTPTTLPVGYGRDTCDPNHQLTQPCALPTESDVVDLSFVNDPVDVFSFLLKGGRQYQIAATVSTAGGIDPTLDVFLAAQVDQPIASNDDVRIGDASAALTMTVDIDGWYLVRVTNRAPGDVRGKTYTMTARSVGASGTQPDTTATNPDDLVGNAYDAAHAVRLAWDVPYDLTMRCPDPRPNACYAGRHTFLLVPVKQGVPLTALTYDLGAGVDTTLTLYQPDAGQTEEGPGLVPGWRVVAANDDAVAGWTVRSQIMTMPTWSGAALLVVGPSDRADVPPVPTEGRPGRYRLILGSPAFANVRAVMAAQTDMPPTPVPPTPRPTSQADPAAVQAAAVPDVREVIKEACPTGLAVVGETATGLYAAAPPGADDRLASYPSGAAITLLGQCYRGWVKVQPADSVTPGWMWGPDLRPETLDVISTPQAGIGTDEKSTPVGTEPRPSDTASLASTAMPDIRAGTVRLTALDPLPFPTTVTLAPASRAVTVEACATDTRDCITPLAGLRVELVLAATRVTLTANVTDVRGTVTLSASVPNGAAVLLVIPALGLETLVSADMTTVPVRVLTGGK